VAFSPHGDGEVKRGRDVDANLASALVAIILYAFSPTFASQMSVRQAKPFQKS